MYVKEHSKSNNISQNKNRRKKRKTEIEINAFRLHSAIAKCEMKFNKESSKKRVNHYYYNK